MFWNIEDIEIMDGDDKLPNTHTHIGGNIFSLLQGVYENSSDELLESKEGDGEGKGRRSKRI